MRWLIYAISLTIVISSIPSIAAGGDGVHWNGYKLDRPNIPNRILTDQNGELYSIHEDNADVNVVAFIFTSCYDVCPLITNNLILAEKQIEDIDYQFISITVDPETDDPAKLKAYSEDYSADWPHLTGTQEELQTVWNDFQINVVAEEIDSHEHSNENMTHEMVVLYPDNTSSIHKVGMSSLPTENATGWNLTTATTTKDNVSLNYSTHEEYGNSVIGINGTDSPEDWSWYWTLYLWNNDNSTWQESSLGVDSIIIMQDTNHIAWVASNANQSMIPIPMSAGMNMNNSSETSISHSTQTFILDEDWKPLIVYTGSSWDVENFVEDIERAVKNANHPDHSDSHMPGFTIHIIAISLGVAIIASRRFE